MGVPKYRSKMPEKKVGVPSSEKSGCPKFSGKVGVPGSSRKVGVPGSCQVLGGKVGVPSSARFAWISLRFPVRWRSGMTIYSGKSSGLSEDVNLPLGRIGGPEQPGGFASESLEEPGVRSS